MVTFFTLLLTIILSAISAGVMSFIAMASPVGPWIDVTLVLLGMLVVKTFFRTITQFRMQEMVGYSAAASALGGSVATACGFSFPTLYFLKPELFAHLLHNPFLFIALFAGLILVAGGLGMLVAHLCAPAFLADESMPFPIGHMTYSLISVGNNIRKAYELMAGVVIATFFTILQIITHVIPKKITLIKQFALNIWTIPSVIVRPDWILMLLYASFLQAAEDPKMAGRRLASEHTRVFSKNSLIKEGIEPTEFKNWVDAFYGALKPSNDAETKSVVILQRANAQLKQYIVHIFKANCFISVIFLGIT